MKRCFRLAFLPAALLLCGLTGCVVETPARREVVVEHPAPPPPVVYRPAPDVIVRP